jgi:hypothetical protein
MCMVGLAASEACSTTRYGGPGPTPEIEAALRAENARAPVPVDAVVAVGPPGRWSLEMPLVRVDPAFGVIVWNPSGQDQQLSTNQIVALRVHHRARGAAVGAGIGLLAGGALGVGLADAEDRNCPPVSVDCSGRAHMAGFGIVFGLLGMLVGLGVGALVDPTTTVRFGDPRPDD